MSDAESPRFLQATPVLKTCDYPRADASYVGLLDLKVHFDSDWFVILTDPAAQRSAPA